MRVIIAGSRSVKEIEAVNDALAYAAQEDGIAPVTVVLCGMANGADLLGKQWAESKGIPVEEHPADWDRHGRAAGIIRNKEMAKAADAAVVIWDGKSPGSRHMIQEMRRLGKPCYVYWYEYDPVLWGDKSQPEPQGIFYADKKDEKLLFGPNKLFKHRESRHP